MKKLLLGFVGLLLLAATPALADNPLGFSSGAGPAPALVFANGTLPITGNTAASQCVQTNAGNTALVLGSCGGSATYPAGSPPQIGGFSAVNTSEAETVSGDATFTRAGANSYTIAVTKTSGTAFGPFATQAAPCTAAQGCTGVASPTAHSLVIAEGASAFTVLTAATAGNIVVDQGSGSDFLLKAVSGDSTLTSGGVMANTGLHFGAANAVSLPTTAPTSGGIPYFSSTSAIASSALLTANLPVIGGGAGTAPTVGTVSGNTTKFTTTTGTLTSGNALKSDANGNAVDAGGPPIISGTAGTVWDKSFFYASTPSASQVVAYTATYAMTIPANLAGSQATCGNNPAESDAYSINKNGVATATVTLSTACAVTLSTQAAFSLAAGDRLSITAPATVSGQNISISLQFTR